MNWTDILGDRSLAIGTTVTTVAAAGVVERVDCGSIGVQYAVTSIAIMEKRALGYEQSSSSRERAMQREEKIRKLRADLKKAEQSMKDELDEEGKDKEAKDIEAKDRDAGRATCRST